MQKLPGLYITQSKGRGRGVFTAELIPADSIIEICPVIVIPTKDKPKIHQTVLHDYYFDWNLTDSEAAIALGYGSIYNHSDNPGADYEMDYDNNEIVIRSILEIAAGTEIFLSYLHLGKSDNELWFKPVDQ